VTVYLTVEQVLFIHARVIAETGGTHGLRDLGLLQSAVARPQATYSGEELYPGIFTKAAALLDSLVNNHAFLDGNKRTAITSVGIFLRMNGYRLEVVSAEMVTFMLRCAQGEVPLAEMAGWLEDHAQTS
jgi:death-on-curing protein